MPEIFFLLVCRECGNGDLVMPFDSAAERGKWAAGHTKATGHDRWFVTESAWRLSGQQVAEMMARNDEVLRSFADGPAGPSALDEILRLRRALAEKAAEISRLQAELDGLRQVPVEYAPPAALEAAMTVDPDREDGTILRETGGERRAFEWKAQAGEWVRIS